MAKVEIYTTMMCSYCFAAKNLLSKKGVDYLEVAVDRDPGKRSEMTERAKGSRTVPQIFINDTHIGGCDELYALDAAGKLDALLEATT